MEALTAILTSFTAFTLHIKKGRSKFTKNKEIMKLELKHLAPYLPYRLKMRCIEDKTNHILTIAHQTYDLSTVGLYPILKGDFYKKFKPILRPLSDLTKDLYQDEILIRWGGGLSEKATVKWLKAVTDEMKLTAYNALRFDFVEFMLEHHFDIFNLIPQGLAISINDINK